LHRRRFGPADAEPALGQFVQQWLWLSKFYGRNGPLAFMSRDGNPKAVQFIQPNFFHCPGFAIGQYDAFADKVGLRLLELGKDF
jgi:hypothetical protein